MINLVKQSGYYQINGSDIIPSGTYWVDVSVSGNGQDFTLTLFESKNSQYSSGFINYFGRKPWNGFFGDEMLPCCDLRQIKIQPAPQRELVAA